MAAERQTLMDQALLVGCCIPTINIYVYICIYIYIYSVLISVTTDMSPTGDLGIRSRTLVLRVWPQAPAEEKGK